MRLASTLLLTCLALLISITNSPAAPTKQDLSGRWHCDDGGTYFVRQVGNELWWTGKSGEKLEKGKKKAFANVYHGKIDGNKVVGSWADDPAGEAMNAGILNLEIVVEDGKLHLKKTDETGGFSGAMWTPGKK
jgi:hypothetical protein